MQSFRLHASLYLHTIGYVLTFNNDNGNFCLEFLMSRKKYSLHLVKSKYLEMQNINLHACSLWMLDKMRLMKNALCSCRSCNCVNT